MNFIPYLLSLLVVILGGIVALVISHYAREELKTGKRYFMIAQIVLLLLVVVATGFFVSDPVFIGVLALVFLSAVLIHVEVYNYMLFGVALALAVGNQDLFTYIAAISFLYFMISSSFFYRYAVEMKHETLKFIGSKLIGKYLLFLLIAILGYLL